MVDFIVILFVGAFGLLVFGVVFLVRRALAGDRRTHAAVEEIEGNFAELKGRVESLSRRIPYTLRRRKRHAALSNAATSHLQLRRPSGGRARIGKRWLAATG